MSKYIFTTSWFVIIFIYFMIFCLSIGCAITVADEYDGGNTIAEFGANLFIYVFGLPMLTLMEVFNSELGSNDSTPLFILFILNSMINFFIFSTLLNFIYMKLRSILRKIVLLNK